MNSTQSNFTKTGQYDNTFDESGNLVIVDGSEKYLAVILNEEVYDENSVSKVYSLDIQEFKDVVVVPDKKVESLQSEKANLQKQISDLTTQLSSISSSNKDTLINASKDVIIALRIKAGEGFMASDFNTSFPYLPLYSAAAKQSNASGIAAPTVQSATTTGSSTNSTTTNSSTSSAPTTQSAQEGVVCDRQQQIQLIPPTDILIPKPPGPKPVLPPVVYTPPPTVVPVVELPIHQSAVNTVVPPAPSCNELFYKYGKYQGVWEANGLPSSPMINTYGVYSDNVSDTYEYETSDTLSYQVYIPVNGTYTIKFSVDKAGYIDMDGVKLIDLTNVNSSSPYDVQLDAYLNDHATTKTLTAGWKNVNLFYKNWGGPHSVAASIIYDGRIVWNSRMAYNAQDYQNCSGITVPSNSVPLTDESNSSNGGGGGCPAVWQVIETKELGITEARNIKVGMHLRDSQMGIWNRVNVASVQVAPIYRIDIGGQTFDVDHSHKWYVGNNQWVTVKDMKPGDYVENTKGEKIKVNKVYYLRDDEYMHMNVDRQRYVMGIDIIGHNAFDSKKF